MKFTKILTLIAAGMMALTACERLKEVDYKTFFTTLTEARKQEDVEIEVTTISGTMKNEDKNIDYKVDNLKLVDNDPKSLLALSTYDLTIVLLVAAANLRVYTPRENKENKYFVGNGYKIEGNETVMKWDTNLNLTYIKGLQDDDILDLRISYTYMKVETSK